MDRWYKACIISGKLSAKTSVEVKTPDTVSSTPELLEWAEKKFPGEDFAHGQVIFAEIADYNRIVELERDAKPLSK